MIKNIASQKVGSQMITATDGSAFGGAVTVSVTGDAGTQATGATGAGACAHEGNGYHTYGPTQAETNYDLVAFTFTGSGAVPQTVQVYTRAETPDVNVLTMSTGSVTATAIASGAIDRDAFAADTGLQSIRSDTAQAGAASTITLDTGANATNDFYNDTLIYLTGGTGAGQSRVITDYDGTTKVATVNEPWVTNPASGTTFAIFPTVETAADIAVAVWDEPLAGHLTAGSTGEALDAAGTAGDPWITALPGAYGAGTAGKIVGDNINATISSRATQTSVDDLPTNAELATSQAAADDATLAAIAAMDTKVDTIDTVVDAILVDTGTTLDGKLDTIDTVVDAILVDTTEIGVAGAGLTNINLPNQTMDIIGNLSGSVGSVTGAVGSVTGSVGGNVNGSVAGSVGSVTGNVGGNVAGSVGSLAAQAKADVNAEVLDVLVTDTFAEPAVVPAATASLKDKIGWQAAIARNKITQTGSSQTVFKDDGVATIGSSAVSDDGTTATRGEFS